MQKVKKNFCLPLYLSVALLVLAACEKPVVEPEFNGKYVELVEVDYIGDWWSPSHIPLKYKRNVKFSPIAVSVSDILPL